MICLKLIFCTVMLKHHKQLNANLQHTFNMKEEMMNICL